MKPNAERVVMAAPDIKGLIFDCFGVLYVGSLQMLYELTPKEKWNELHDLSIGSDYGYISREEYLQSIAKLSGRTYEEMIALQERVHVRNEALIDYARELHKTYKIAMLSNVGRDLVEKLFSKQELAELFDVVSLSYESGLLKPHPKAYQEVAEKLGLAPGQCIMIDDLEKNIEGADAAGMQGIAYTDLDNLKADLARILKV